MNCKKWAWHSWKNTGHEIIGGGSSCCMVDHDRFMAIMNVDNGKKCYLHAMNETKLSIPLADACENRYHGRC